MPRLEWWVSPRANSKLVVTTATGIAKVPIAKKPATADTIRPGRVYLLSGIWPDMLRKVMYMEESTEW
jgi:hypothetical protein